MHKGRGYLYQRRKKLDVLEKRDAKILIEKYRPLNTDIKFRKDNKLAPAHSKIRGWCEIKTPFPTDLFSLATFIHECAHITLGHEVRQGLSQHQWEYEAERFTMKALRDEGFTVTKPLLAWMKGYIRDCIKEDRATGVRINPQIRRWAYGE